jgi:hypothetical protein
MSFPSETLTSLGRALWVVDNAFIISYPPLDEHGRADPDFVPGQPIPVAEALERRLRPTRRGVLRIGLTIRLFLALLFVASGNRETKIERMYQIATEGLPRETQWALGILTRDKHGTVRTLSRKQLYNMAEKFTEYLDVDPEREYKREGMRRRKLTAAERQDRMEFLNAVKDALVNATHVLPHDGTSFAVDESGVWAWAKGRRKPSGLPEVDEADVNAQLAAEVRSGKEEDGLLEEGWYDDAVDYDATGSGTHYDAAPEAEPPSPLEKCRAPLACWWASWGVKTHKTGRPSSYFGYALHALMRVPDLVKGDGKIPRTTGNAEPRLIQAFDLTSASTDVVSVTLGMIRRTIAQGAPVVDLLVDRHYSYKDYERWAAQLWALGVRQVLDLRSDEHGVIDYNGAQIIAGTPHCGVPAHLLQIKRPGRGASPAQVDQFYADISARQQYAFARKKTAWQDRDGKTRWSCCARNGTVGCPLLAGSVDIALANQLPIVRPPEGELPWCKQVTATIESGKHMKSHQEEYWGTPAWLASFDRRTYVEGAFGYMKNHHSGNIHRGFMCFTGMPLVTLAVTAAVVNFNLDELENWFDRATAETPNNPLLSLYESHPLHQRTEWLYGFTMLSKAEADALDEPWLRDGAEPDGLDLAA